MEIKELEQKITELEQKLNEIQKQVNTMSLYNAATSRLLMEQQPEELTKTVQTIIKEIQENKENEKIHKTIKILNLINTILAISSIITLLIELAQPNTNQWITYGILIMLAISTITNFILNQIYNNYWKKKALETLTKPNNEN